MYEFARWLFYLTPWWVQMCILALPVLIVFYVAIRVFGYERVKGFILPALAILGAIGLLGRAKQQGYADRKDVQKKAQDNALKDFNDIEKNVDAKPIDQVDKDNAKWLRD